MAGWKGLGGRGSEALHSGERWTKRVLARFDPVPEISRFFGIVVRMYYDDHSPPHFHATYGSFKVVVGLSDLAILKGGLPPRALGLLMEWAVQHRDELAENWRLAAAMKPLKSIAPLE